MGTLFLPSLTEKKFHVVSDVTLAEASTFMQDFTNHVADNRKTKNNGATCAEPIVFTNIIDFDDLLYFEPEDLANSLNIAKTPGTRGARAVFVDADNDVFAVGTTVVYNKNWATLNFDDDTIIENLEDNNWPLRTSNDEDDNEVSSWW